VRAVGLHADVVVATSRVYKTTCTLVRSGEEAFCIDSPILPDELEILPALAEQSGFTVVGLLATHADWDHLLGRYAFPEAPLGCADTTAGRLINEPGAAQRAMREFDEEHYVERPRPLRIGSHPPTQRLSVPGKVEVGDQELELQPADGHTVDGMAVWIPWARVLVCGDYLSPVEIPMLHAKGAVPAYLATLARLVPLVEQADHVVPGHGEPIDSARAAAILREDRAYLEALLEHGAAAKLPLARRTGAQRAIHERNAGLL
jgi:glyoxylase-like metal-dependent hydrolase (beta-lactamase superfamily II)